MKKIKLFFFAFLLIPFVGFGQSIVDDYSVSINSLNNEIGEAEKKLNLLLDNSLFPSGNRAFIAANETAAEELRSYQDSLISEANSLDSLIKKNKKERFNLDITTQYQLHIGDISKNRSVQIIAEYGDLDFKTIIEALNFEIVKEKKRKIVLLDKKNNLEVTVRKKRGEYFLKSKQ